MMIVRTAKMSMELYMAWCVNVIYCLHHKTIQHVAKDNKCVNHVFRHVGHISDVILHRENHEKLTTISLTQI